MSDSFVMNTGHRTQPSPKRRKVLVTGAAGQIGSYFAAHSHEKHDLTLMVRDEDDTSAIEEYGRVVTAELGDLERLKELFAGIDTVVHLAASASPSAVWDDLLQNNIIGAYNAFIAAGHAGCRRVIYASSIHAVSGYPHTRQVHADDPVNPGDLYGVSKCFVESLARFMAEQHGLSAIVIRVGAFQPLETARAPDSARLLDAFISQRDLNQLILRCIDNEDLKFAILHGLSNNAFNRMDICETCELVGYEPQDDLARENPQLHKTLHPQQPHSEEGEQETGIREQL